MADSGGGNGRYVSGRFPASSKPVKKAESGRLCAIEDCGVVLSVYNHGKLCSLHDVHKGSFLNKEASEAV